MLDSLAKVAVPLPAREAARAVPWWGRMALLWTLFAPVCALFYTLSLPLGPNDFWYHASAGRFICETGTLPQHALFTSAQGFTTPATPYYYQSWLAEIGLYTLLKLGGLSAVVIARSVLVAFAFGILAWTAQRRLARVLPASDDTTRARWACVGALLGFGMCALNLDTRPQMFSVPLFALFVAGAWEWPFLSSGARWKVGALLCALMTLWSNTHGAFITALLLVGATAGGETLRQILTREKSSPAKSLCALSSALVLSACVNPRGAGLFAYAFGMARDPMSRKYIAEWQRPQVSTSEWYNAIFFASFLLLPLLAWRAHKRGVAASSGQFVLRSGEVAALMLLAYLGHDMTRGVIWYALACAPAISVLGACAFASSKASQAATPPASSLAARLNAVLASVLLLAPLVMLPRAKANLGLGPEFAARFAPNPRGDFPLGYSGDPPLLLDKGTPTEAAVLLRHSPPRAHLWNDMVFGSYLTWATAPQILPSCDPRVELYPHAFWEEYRRVLEGAPEAARVLQSRGYSDALLDRETAPKLIARLKAAGWRVLLVRRNAVLLRRNNANANTANATTNLKKAQNAK